MESTGSRPSSRAFRLVGGTLGAVASFAILGLLLAGSAMVWYFEVSLPEQIRVRAEAERKIAHTAAAAAPAALTEAARDGRLTDDEIAKAVGGPVWDVQRSESRWLLRARFEGTDPICYSYELTLPLGPGNQVTSTELPSCPTIRPGG